MFAFVADNDPDGEGGDVVQDAPAMAASGYINANADWWLRICSSSWTRQWVKEGFPLWWKTHGLAPAPTRLANLPGAVEQCPFVHGALSQLLAADAVREDPYPSKVVNPLNAVPKPRQPGKYRLILDLRYIKKFVFCPKFKIRETVRLRTHLAEGQSVVPIDLTNSYWQLRMREDAWEYLGFEWEGRYCVSTVLPLGFVSAPWAFFKANARILRSSLVARVASDQLSR